MQKFSEVFAFKSPYKIVSYSATSIPELIKHHNRLAAERGRPPLKKNWKGSRLELVEMIARLRTCKPLFKLITKSDGPKPGSVIYDADWNIIPIDPPRRGRKPRKPQKKQPSPVRDAILATLSIIAQVDPESGKTIGLPYNEILKRVREKCPQSKISKAALRWTATQVRAGARGFENCILPDVRPCKSYEYTPLALKKQPVPRPMIRPLMLELLATIERVEEDGKTVGLSRAEIVRRIRAKVPASKVTTKNVATYEFNVRYRRIAGWETCKLPEVRPC